MTKGFRFFLIVFILSLPFFWGVNILEKNLGNFFYWQEMPAQTSQLVLKLSRAKNISGLEIEAKSAISVLVDTAGAEKVLFGKESNKKMPLASLSKLMATLIVLENYEPDDVVKISQNAAQVPESEKTRLRAGEKFLVKDLVYLMLVESNNISTVALAELIGEGKFVELMNIKAKELQLFNTFFANPTGLDSPGRMNYSTAKDLAKFSKYLSENYPSIWEVLSIPEFNLSLANGDFHHQVVNTNQLLGEIPSIVGGKTGETPRAGGCLLEVTEAPKGKGYIINVILNSPYRFGEMEKLINWLKSAYQW